MCLLLIGVKTCALPFWGDIVGEVYGGAIVEADQLLAYALATGGGGTSPSGTTGRSGDTLGGTIDIGVANGSLLQIESAPSLVAYAAPMVSEITGRSEEHTSELQSLMRISYAVFCLKKKKKQQTQMNTKTLK